MALLSIDSLRLSFAGVRALDGVSLDVEEGSLVAVIGPNGAGKSSLFNCISGFYRPEQGSITFDGQPLMGRSPHEVAKLGVARSFQNLALFDHLTVLENLQLGCHLRYRSRFFHDLVFSARARREEVRHRRKVEEVIDLLDLERYRLLPVGILPYGVAKRVELGRALCMEPRLLLLDEPAAGLNQEATEDLARYVLDIKEELSVTQVLIEHDLRFVLELADKVCVLDFGQKITEGPPDEVRRHPRVIEAYTGGAGESRG